MKMASDVNGRSMSSSNSIEDMFDLTQQPITDKWSNGKVDAQ